MNGLENFILSEISETAKAKCYMVSLIYGNLKNNKNEFIYEIDSQRDTESELKATKGERDGGRMN